MYMPDIRVRIFLKSQFHLLHKDDMTRIKQETVCPSDNKTLNVEDIVRGYQYGKDKYVVVTHEDQEKTKKESQRLLTW